MRMRRLLLLALFIASAAQADDDACFELGGQGIAPCATPRGKVAIESNLIDWTRDGHGADRDDQIAFAGSIARIGLGGDTEARLAWTPLILDRPRGGPTTSGTGDMRVGLKHQFGKDAPIGFAAEVTLPTASNGVGQGTWSAAAIVPMQFELSEAVSLDLQAEADAAADGDRSGRHFAWSLVAGAEFDLSKSVSLVADVKRLRDDDPMEHTTETTAGLALNRKLGAHGQVTLAGVAGLDHDAPVAEAYLGAAYLF